jgi:hypothetical protein
LTRQAPTTNRATGSAAASRFHHFERLVDEPTRPLDLRIPRRFATVMPASPLSYDGVIVKVCWCVRVRLYLSQGQETVTEIPFSFGNVPAGQIEQPIAD